MTSQLMKGAGTRSLLYRILESPEQVSALQRLPPPALARLIHHVGLEDAGELVALATTRQLALLFDEDLWRSERPGQQERFDTERFGLWLEVLLEMGADRAAARLAEMDEDFVTFALSGQVLVLDLDALTLHRPRPIEGREDEESLVDKALESSLCHELDRFLLIARRPESWDALLSVLVALDESHHELLTSLLERCCHLAAEHIEDDGASTGALLAREGLVPSFGRGWQVLHEDVVMWSARALEAALARRVPGGRGEAAQVRAGLTRDIAAGRPWASRRRWVHFAPFLSKEAFAAVRELVDECPVLNGVFLATREQVEEARRRLRSLLHGG